VLALFGGAMLGVVLHAIFIEGNPGPANVQYLFYILGAGFLLAFVVNLFAFYFPALKHLKELDEKEQK
jgi:hypothetical protein